MAHTSQRCVNGKWLAQSPSGTQRYASEVMEVISRTPRARDLLLILPRDAVEPDWAAHFETVRSRFRGIVFEQLALPWITRGMHLYSMAGPAPLLKRDQTVVMHDAMPFRYPGTFRLAFVVWYWLMYGLLSRTARRLLTVSEFSRAELARALRVSPTRFELAPCGSDHLEPSGAGVVAPFPAGSFALIVGNLAPHKNVAPAAAALADAGVPVVVVGAAQQVFRQAARTDRPNLKFLGRIDDADLQLLYRAAGVLVAPSIYEGFGIPVVEAGREGCPTVFALGSALTEVVGEGGLGFDVSDMSECVALVRKVLTHEVLRRTLAERARANARRFSWIRTAGAIFGDTHPTVRVLHVTETFCAGTGTAIIEYAKAVRAGGVESFLLAQDRGSGLLAELEHSSPFCGAQIVEPGLVTLWRALPRAVAELRPDVVHLHSSLAGAVGRLQLPLAGRPAVVYSPHCFAFERRDVPRRRRWVYFLAELLLARRTDAFVSVSPHEKQLAAGLHSKAAVHEVINMFVSVHDPSVAPADDPRQRLVTVGRVASQKNPELFLEIFAALTRKGHAEATWVGGGDAAMTERLQTAHVAVTGWLPAAQVPAAIAGHTVYLHTAGWEASVPIAVLDAMSIGLPVVVKRNDAYREILPDTWQFDDVATAVEMIDALKRQDARENRIQEQFDLLADLRQRGPEKVLADIYRRIANASSTSTSVTTGLRSTNDYQPLAG